MQHLAGRIFCSVQTLDGRIFHVDFFTAGAYHVFGVVCTHFGNGSLFQRDNGEKISLAQLSIIYVSLFSLLRVFSLLGYSLFVNALLL